MNQIVTHNDAAALPAPVSETANTMAVIERILIANPNPNVEAMKAMMDMQERILDRNAKQAFNAALAQMQPELPVVEKNGQIVHEKNGERKLISKYAKFEDIFAAVRPVLQKFGFSCTFRIKQTNGTIETTAVLSHRDGHSEETSITLPADTGGAKNAVQAQGSTVSYGKRYTMEAILGLTSRGQDDDGKDGGDAVTKITEQQADTIKDLVMQGSTATREWFMEKYGAFNQVPKADFDKLVAKLRNALEKAAKNGAAA